jgi:hypothetical protein
VDFQLTAGRFSGGFAYRMDYKEQQEDLVLPYKRILRNIYGVMKGKSIRL